MTEVGVAYLSIVPETSRIAPGIRSALGAADTHASAAGRSIGNRMSSALGTALKGGVAAAGATAVAGIGYTLTKGFSRLNAIDQAQAKLRALGSSGAEVESIMKNALASVKGTAFGLGDAAGLAGTMVAAGIKPGRELESVLKTVADSAAVAGSDLNDMGQIFGTAAAKGKIDGEILAQLMERQIGILPELAAHYKVTREEAAKMVSDGKVSFEDFAQVMQEKVGGGAKEMGQTVQGAFENLKAAAGRVGASALEPLFKALPGGFNGITEAIDALEPKVSALVEGLSSKAITEWAPKIKEAFTAAKDSGEFDRILDVLRGLAETGADVWPALQQIGQSLATAGAAIGFGTWRLFLVTLQAVGGAVNLITPALELLGNLMEAHPGLVTAAVGAWMMFKTIPALVGRVSTATGGLQTRMTSLWQTLRAAATAQGAVVQATGLSQSRMMQLAGVTQTVNGRFRDLTTGRFIPATTAMGRMSSATGIVQGRFGSMIATLGQTSSTLQRMQQSFVNTSTSASRFGRTMGTATALGTGLKAGIGGVVGALGGPVGLGITATLGAGMWALSRYQQGQQDAAEAARNHENRIKSLTDSLNVYTGALDSSGRKQVVNNLQDDGKLDALRFNQGKGLKVTSKQYVDAATGNQGAIDYVNSQLNSQIIAGMNEHKKAFDAVGLTQEEMAAALRGNSDAVAKWEASTNWKISAAKDTLDEAGRNALDLSAEIGDVNGMLTEAQRRGRQFDEAMGGVAARMPAIRDALKDLSKGESVKIDTQQIQGAEKMLESFGFKINDLGDGQVQVTALTDDANAKLKAVAGNVELLNLMKANPGVGLNDSAFRVTDQNARAALANLDRTKVDPKAGLVIDNLLQNKAVSMNELISLSNTTADPKVKMEIAAIMAQIDTVNRGLDEAARRREATIFVRTAMEEGRFPTPLNPQAAAGYGYRPPQQANGSIVPARAYVDGGIRAAEEFANGGLKRIEKPKRADIFAGRGEGTIFAEKETGGEAYVPLANSKRARSTEILAVVADMFGLALVPKESTASGLLGGLAGGTVSKLLQKAGADNITRFADGGFNAKQLRDLADGHGASQPLTGAPYVWGGVNWGDCSGAMSAFTRAAAGLNPFGGRWSTGSAAADLPAMGFKQGLGSSGDMRVGFYNGGPGGGHTAGTLPDGTRVEMGGGNGGGMVGGSAAGADSPQFTDHWYLPVGPSWTDAGEDPGGVFTKGQPGTETAGTVANKPSTLSELVGDAAKTAVAGQVADVLNVFGINDSPGALAAWAGLPVKEEEKKKEVDPKKLREAQDTVTDKENALKIARTQLDEAKKNKKIKPSQLLAAQGKVDRLERDLGQAKADLKALQDAQDSPTSDAPSSSLDLGKLGRKQKLRDPGTHRPKKGEDTGVGKLSSVDAIKNAFKGGLREAWRSGDQWSATDWIVNKESTWKPDARNGKYFGLIQAGADVYRAAGVDPNTTDPALQAKAFDKYVDGRYKTPVDAKAFHEANNWYDQGGIAPRKGLMLKNINTPERVLSPRQTSAFEQMVRRDFQSGIGTDVIVAKLDELISEIRMSNLGQTYVAPDLKSHQRQQRQRTRNRALAGMGDR